MSNYELFLTEVDTLTRKWKSTTEIVMMTVCAFVNIALNLLVYTNSESLSQVYLKLGVNLSVILFIVSILPLFMLTISVLKYNKVKARYIISYLVLSNIPTFYNLHFLSVNTATSNSFTLVFTVNIIVSCSILWLYSQVSFNQRRIEETMTDSSKYPTICFVLSQVSSNPNFLDKHGLDLTSEIEYINASNNVGDINFPFRRYINVLDEVRKTYFASENYVSVKVRSNYPQIIKISIDGTTKTMNLETAEYLITELETAISEIKESEVIDLEFELEK